MNKLVEHIETCFSWLFVAGLLVIHTLSNAAFIWSDFFSTAVITFYPQCQV